MTGRATSVSYALLSLVGPVIWAAHFFAVYLAEAVLCSPAVANESGVVVAGAGLTIAALIPLLWARRLSKHRAGSPFTRPLIDLSIVAVVLTAIPLVMIGACRPAGA